MTRSQNGALLLSCAALIRYSIPVYLSASLITLSARNSTDCGIVRPICLAVFRLFTNSNLVGLSTGRSPRVGSLKHLVHINGGAARNVWYIRAIGHKTTSIHEFAPVIDRW